MGYLLCHKKSRPTGRKIADALGMKSRFQSVSRTQPLAIRWGSAQFSGTASAIQSAEAIARAGNKLVSLQCFKRDGVPCPEFAMQCALPTTEVWFGRNTHGMCGTDIRVIEPGVMPAAGRSDFYTKFIPNTREYRIHVFKEEILGVMGKYLDFPAEAGDGYIKNVAHGYRFRTPAKALHTNRGEAAIAAVKSLGLDFGAVDLIVGTDGNPYVLEVNTAPALAPLMFDKYVAAFKAAL